jgi:tripartite-type tricarboxylate transporter receptor subunit TctC
MNAKTFCRLLGVTVLFILWGAAAFSQSSFYEGKTITIVQGREPGDAGDMRVKAMLPFIQKYIPGNPTIVSEYMPGGGGRKAANHVYRNVKPDGLTLGNLGAGFISNAVMGETGVQYDIDKFVYLGSPYSAAHYLFLTRRDLQASNLEKLRVTPGIRIGAQSVGHTIYIVGRLFAWLLPLKEPKFITAYGGTKSTWRSSAASSTLERRQPTGYCTGIAIGSTSG